MCLQGKNANFFCLRAQRFQWLSRLYHGVNLDLNTNDFFYDYTIILFKKIYKYKPTASIIHTNKHLDLQLQALRRVLWTGPCAANHATSYCVERSSVISEMAVIKRLHTYHIIIIIGIPPPSFCAATRLITCICIYFIFNITYTGTLSLVEIWFNNYSRLLSHKSSYSPIIDKCLKKGDCDSIQICAFPQLTPCLTSKIFILFISFLYDTWHL